MYKRCTPEDQEDPLEEFHTADLFSMVHDEGYLSVRAMPNLGQLKHLTEQPITYPVRNRAKTINTNIINFQSVDGLPPSGIKRDVFMFEFDLIGAAAGDPEKMRSILELDEMTNERTIMFRINGVAVNHGEASVFTDDLHYILKGNKLLKCCLEQVNIYKDQVMQ